MNADKPAPLGAEPADPLREWALQLYAHETSLREVYGPNEAKRLVQPLWDAWWKASAAARSTGSEGLRADIRALLSDSDFQYWERAHSSGARAAGLLRAALAAQPVPADSDSPSRTVFTFPDGTTGPGKWDSRSGSIVPDNAAQPAPRPSVPWDAGVMGDLVFRGKQPQRAPEPPEGAG